jgi:hypothetical protein
MTPATVAICLNHRGVVGGQLAVGIGMALRTVTQGSILVARGMMNGSTR